MRGARGPLALTVSNSRHPRPPRVQAFQGGPSTGNTALINRTGECNSLNLLTPARSATPEPSIMSVLSRVAAETVTERQVVVRSPNGGRPRRGCSPVAKVSES